MFKKMVVIMMVLGLVFAGSSMACEDGKCGDVKSDVYPTSTVVGSVAQS
jgi:hypothetical protein